MKNLIKFLLICFLCIHGVCYADVRTIVIQKNYAESAEIIENFLKENAVNSNIMVFTRVPRGLIVSIDEKYLFNENSTKLKASAIPVLNDILFALRSIDSRCVVEGHTEKNDFQNKPYDYNWELSLLRAGNIVKYLMLYGKIKSDRLFTLGYGEYMPSVDNVDEKLQMNNRIDFVFIDYKKNTRQ